jgi:hypothetical protein
MQDSLGTWSIKGSITTVAATARLGVQYAASATNTAEVLYFKISQSGSTTSAMDSVSLVRLSAGATVTIGATGTNIFDYSGGAGTFRGTLSTSATGVVATTAGTVTDITHQMDFNVLAGYEWNAQPNTRIWVPISGIIGVRCDALVALTYNVTLVIRESK